MGDGLGEAAIGVHLRGEAAGRNELMNVACRAVEQAGVAPELRRPFAGDGTAQTLRFFARRAGVFPEDVHGADQPVLMREIHFDVFAAARRFHGERRRSQKRRVVKLDHVVAARIEDLLNCPTLESGTAGLLRNQRRESSEAAAQLVAYYAGMLGEADLRLRRVEHVISVAAMDNVHVMPGIGQSVGEPVDVHRISAETIRRIKRGEV